MINDEMYLHNYVYKLLFCYVNLVATYHVFVTMFVRIYEFELMSATTNCIIVCLLHDFTQFSPIQTSTPHDVSTYCIVT